MASAYAFDLILAAIALVGHFSITVWLFNRLHATAWPRPRMKAAEKALLLASAALVALFVSQCLRFGTNWQNAGWHWQAYLIVCPLAATLVIPCWLIPKLMERTPLALVSNHTTQVDVRERLGFSPVHGAEAKLLAAFPGNEILHLAVQRKALRLGNLPAALEGLTIAHLTDLHMTGEMGREFYDVMVDETNALVPDLIAITGDILEKAECLPWILPTLGRLKARYGKYFILGNHEMRLAEPELLRRALGEAGFTDLGSRCERIEIQGIGVLLAGNELPWFGTAPEIRRESNSEFRMQNSEFRILLSHTPDLFPWAKANDFDLMLAGHNHGGQIRLPYLGALISPSRFGFRYAGGLYHEPPTLLHVSRGIAGVHPIRLNCPPEIALLVLQAT